MEMRGNYYMNRRKCIYCGTAEDEAESKVQMEVFQAISDTEREVRNMYEEKLRDADKEVIRLQVQLEQLNSK